MLAYHCDSIIVLTVEETLAIISALTFVTLYFPLQIHMTCQLVTRLKRDVIHKTGSNNVGLLQCTSTYNMPKIVEVNQPCGFQVMYLYLSGTDRPTMYYIIYGINMKFQISAVANIYKGNVHSWEIIQRLVNNPIHPSVVI